MVQLAIPAWPKWILTGLTALALVVGLGDSLSLSTTSMAVAQDELPEENVPAEENAEPAPANNDNDAPAAVGDQSAEGETSYLVWVRLECLPYDRFRYNNRVDSWGPPSQSSSQNRGW